MSFSKSSPQKQTGRCFKVFKSTGNRVKNYQTKAEKIAKKTERAKKKMELIARCKGDAQK